MPYTDIYETDEAPFRAMEMLGLKRENVDLAVDNDVLRVQSKVESTKYRGLEPVHTEYNIGHYARSFALSRKRDQKEIKAEYGAVVLMITLPRSAEARPRRIKIA